MAKKILIIEDEKTLARALEHKLTRSGYMVSAVFNGEDGIKRVQKEIFDLILLDLIMPKVDGFAVLAVLKAENIMTPVIVLTNLGQEHDMKQAKEFGAKDFFIKSNTSIASIVEHVTELLK
jgi:DNA-binding response OmpR family regulator